VHGDFLIFLRDLCVSVVKFCAVEVKSGRARSPASLPGLAFAAAHEPRRTLLVGGDGIDVEEFLSRPVDEWLAP
jgi:uncharacterized protein